MRLQLPLFLDLTTHHPNFDVRIVVDSSQDEAWEVVQPTVRDLHADRVSVSELVQRRLSCKPGGVSSA